MNQPPKTQIDPVARHDLDETFADSLSNVSFDGQCWRFEFSVTRLEGPKPPNNILHGKTVPVCRLVMPPKSGVEFAVRLNDMMNQLVKQGVIKKTPIMPMPTGSGKPN